MKKNLQISSNFFNFFSLTLLIGLLILSSLTTKVPAFKKETTSNTETEILSCTQADLIICNYGSILAFVNALVMELNNQLNNCGGALVDCNPEEVCCYTNTVDFTFTSALSSGKNPFFYCTNESCNTFTCSSLSGSGSQHNDLSVANQNEILTRMRNAANNAVPCGAGNGSNKPISNYRVYMTGPSGSCSVDGPCYNMTIKLEVTYLCGCQG
ncbi:MAG: hypothetical protein ABI851_09715 [Saprospiraceae bacterium]